MAQRTVMRRVCDREDGRDGHEVHLELNGNSHLIDLCTECQEALLAAVEPFLAHTQSPAPVPRKRKVTPPRVIPGEVRAWGAANGVPVPPKGRISRTLEDQFLAAQA